MSKQKFRTKRVFPQTSNVLSSLVNNSKMVAHCPITISKRNQLSILSSVSVVVCKFSSRRLPEKPSLSKSRLLTLSKKSRPRFKTKKASHQISNVLSSLASNLKMVEHFPTITSKKNRPFILSSVFVVVCKSSSRLSP